MSRVSEVQAIVAGALPFERAKATIEIGEILKARSVRNLGNGSIRFNEQLAGMAHSKLVHINRHALTHCLFEETAERRSA